ncbi:hypothetical protein AB0D08_21190 [Kitasatospora sp. NPDC048540]|uniref:hypothetical protein n=1 Tax=unclassified Kitasatospora TaxID=2633591 RepID=UPI0007C6BA57|nr:hypothetical protein [Kitasatospora sp. MBT63]
MNSSGGAHADGPAGEWELCDQCGTLVPIGDAVGLRVPDSSAVTAEARFDGERLLRACCESHLFQLADFYHRRPFVKEELWSGQITRAVGELGPLDEDEMYERVMAVTGLDEEQLMRAVAWRDSQDRS